MKKLFSLVALLVMLISCSNKQDNKAVGAKQYPGNGIITQEKHDYPAIGKIETDSYVFQVHRAFRYEPSGPEVLAGMKPKPGYKFILLDISLKNKSTENLDGGALLVSLKVLSKDGSEYKKPAAVLASYSSYHPAIDNGKEYGELWASYEPGESHREVFCAVEVPVGEDRFTISMPLAVRDREKKSVEVSF